MRSTGVGLLCIVIAVGSVVPVNDSPPEENLRGLLRGLGDDGGRAIGPLVVPKCPQETPIGFFWRKEDVPQALKQRIEVCWTYAEKAK
jgi:hypothetical protein